MLNILAIHENCAAAIKGKREMKADNYSNKRVLIIEDSPTSQAHLKKMCEDMGFEPMVVDNGEMALEKLDKYSFLFYIVDLMMPVIDGRTFIIHLKKKYPDAFIIVQTSDTSETTMLEILQLGISDYFNKPVVFERLEKIIEEGLQKKEK
ncbi:MAG: response regulator [bacterium]|nr:response regulator [bacterium]